MSNSREQELYLKNNIYKTKKSAAITNAVSSIGFSFFYANSFAIVVLTKEIMNFVLLTGFNLFFFLPASVIVSGVQATLAFREAKLKKWKVHPAIRFGIEGTAALAVFAGVVGTFLTQFALWEALPFIFAAVMGMKGIYHLGASVYSTSKAISKSESVDRQKHFTKAGHHLLNAASSMSLSAASVLLYLSLFAGPILAIIGGTLGIVGGIVSSLVGVNKVSQVNQKKKMAEMEVLFLKAKEAAQLNPPRSSRAMLASKLGVSKLHKEVIAKENVTVASVVNEEEKTRSLEEEFRTSLRMK